MEQVSIQPYLILALNETRKTLLASRLHVPTPTSPVRELASIEILPGDGVWFRSLRPTDVALMSHSLDLLFLDSERRVLAAVPEAVHSPEFPSFDGAVEVLELAPGTIARSQTEQGDRIVLDPILEGPAGLRIA